NDLISRHYVMPVEDINPPRPELGARGTAVDINSQADKCPFSSMYSSSSTVVANPHKRSVSPSTNNTNTNNPPGYNPSYADEEYVEEPWPEESDEEDEPNPWGDYNDNENDDQRSDSEYGETTSTTIGRTRTHRQHSTAIAEESETAAESSSVESISTSEGIVKSRTVVDPKVMDAVTGKLKSVDLHS
ncbi:hypothetical protein FRC00_000427, partial [Tulasnella sp. 408]